MLLGDTSSCYVLLLHIVTLHDASNRNVSVHRFHCVVSSLLSANAHPAELANVESVLQLGSTISRPLLVYHEKRMAQ